MRSSQLLVGGGGRGGSDADGEKRGDKKKTEKIISLCLPPLRPALLSFVVRREILFFKFSSPRGVNYFPRLIRFPSNEGEDMTGQGEIVREIEKKKKKKKKKSRIIMFVLSSLL